MSEIIAV